MRQFVKTVIVSQFIDKEAFSNEITKQYETIDDWAVIDFKHI